MLQQQEFFQQASQFHMWQNLPPSLLTLLEGTTISLSTNSNELINNFFADSRS